MQALHELNMKLTALLKKYAALEAENKRLKDTIAKGQVAQEQLNARIAQLEKDMVSVNLSTVAGDEERGNMRIQLDHVITEIDRILNTLND